MILEGIKEHFVRTPKLLNIVTYPNDILVKKSVPVLDSIPHNQPLQDLLDDMVYTIQQYRAVGLSAIQVGIPIRVPVAQDEKLAPIKVINPVIKKSSSDTSYEVEGCLSVPNTFTRILRFKEVEIEYFNEKGELQTIKADGLLGRCIQHEINHLDGELFFDKMHKVQRDSILKKYNRAQRKK